MLPAMPNPAKIKGWRLEHKIMGGLEEQGYSCTRSGGSLGIWDIIAISPNLTRLIQAKSNRWPGTAEMDRIKSFQVPPFHQKEVWRQDDYAREPKIKVIP